MSVVPRLVDGGRYGVRYLGDLLFPFIPHYGLRYRVTIYDLVPRCSTITVI